MLKLDKYKKGIILLDQAVFSGSSFLLTILIARQLTPASFGLYSGIMLGLYLAVSLLSAFIVQPFQVNINRTKNASVYKTFTFWSQLLLMLLLSLVFFPFAVFFGFSSISILILIFAIGFGLHDYFRKTLLALDKPIETLIIDTSAALSQLIALSVFMLTNGKDVNLLLNYIGIAYLLPNLLGIAFIRPFAVNFPMWKVFTNTHFKEGKWLFATALLQWWSGNLFVVVSGLYLGAIALGALRLTQSLFGVLNVLLQTFENYILPQTAGKLSQNQAAASQYLADTSRKAGFLFFPVLLLVFFYAESILNLAGGVLYIPYSYLLQGMAVLYLFIYISQLNT